MNLEEAKYIISQFDLGGKLIYCEPFGEGNINSSYMFCMLYETTAPKRFMLQKVNTTIFLEPMALMRNISLVTEYLKGKIEKAGGDPMRETLTIVKTSKGDLAYKAEDGYYRVYPFIEEATCHQQATPELFYNSAKAFGKFARQLEGFDASLLVDAIPNFHNTPMRYDHFMESVEKDVAGRVGSCKEEIAFLMEQKNLASVIVDEIEKGTIPVRVCHNDTKLNNVMMDNKTEEGVCVIDLDIVMQGSLLYDVGDSIRFGATTAGEDEGNLDLVSCDLEKYEIFIKGYLEECISVMSEKEISLLPYGGIVITYEQALRFLGDYFNGDTYYKVDYPEHNLVRGRNQIKLVQDMLAHLEELNAITKKYVK
ncbi:MAG: aminoglycoside phosphotransferase family protein [Eubacteriales bacterium]